MKSKTVLIVLFLLGLLSTSSFAAGTNLFELAKDSFFDLATNYVFLIVIGIILFISALSAMSSGQMSPLYWGAVAILIISIIPMAAPGSIAFFKTYAPASTVVVP